MIDFENLAMVFIEPGTIAPEVDPRYYRALFPDLRHLSDEQLKRHYDNHGRDEGRTGSPCDLRGNFLASIAPDARALEIGPFTAPTLRGKNIEYFDVLSPDDLRIRAREHNYPIIEPIRVDYVSSTGNLDVVPSGFDAVYSAHCIEHTPDMIAHLRQVERILKPKGRYFLTIPDMRCTFDYYRTPTKSENVLKAHAEGRQVHGRDAVIDYYTLSTHNEPAAHWRGEHGPTPRPDIEARRADAEKALLESDGGYVDVHTWFFTPTNFRSVMSDLHAQGATNLKVERVYNTPHGRNEFNAILAKG